MTTADTLHAVLDAAPPAQAAAAFDCLLVGLACRGGAAGLDAPGRARLDRIYRAAGVPAGTPAAQAAPELEAYLAGLDLDPALLERMEAALVRGAESDRRGRQRASRALLGGAAARWAPDRGVPEGAISVRSMGPRGRLR